MAKFKPWLKMWVDWLDDLKMLDLSLAEQGVWWRLCTLAQKCATDGALVKDNGAALSLNEIASTLRIKTKPDRKVLDSMIRKMTNQGSLHWNSNSLVITHFAERQAKTPSEAPEAVRERVRRYRERQAKVTKSPSSPLTTPTIIEKDIETEAEVESNALRNDRYPVTSKAILAEISQLYEKNFGILTPILADKITLFSKNYQGPLSWIRDAFEEACSQSVRKWAYVEKILETWQAEGRKPHGKGKKPRQERAKPITYISGSGKDHGRKN